MALPRLFAGFLAAVPACGDDDDDDGPAARIEGTMVNDCSDGADNDADGDFDRDDTSRAGSTEGDDDGVVIVPDAGVDG